MWPTVVGLGEARERETTGYEPSDAGGSPAARPAMNIHPIHARYIYEPGTRIYEPDTNLIQPRIYAPDTNS